ncbi:MAG: hypothetical protein H0X12_08370 [Nocardioides sp.]|nr:hypothetical protein [Nocardioides sp.]
MSAVLRAPGLPRRVLLPLAELIAAARLAGDVPLPLRLDAAPAQLDERLGGAAAYDDVRRAVTRADDEGPAGLAALGLLDDGRLDSEAAMALRVLAGGALLIQLDLSAVRRGGVVPLRSWFAAGHGVVAQLSTSGGRDYELAWFAPADWVSQFVRAACLPGVATGESVVPASVSLPSELLVAGCAAVREGRTDVLASLAADHGTAGVAEALTALETTCRGRLRVLMRRRDVDQKPAITTWLLLDDGWRELRPGPGATAQLRRRAPRDLALWLAPSVALAAGVAR